MTLIQRLLRIDKKLEELKNKELELKYRDILKLKGPSLYLKINLFEKQLGLKWALKIIQ